MGEQVSEETTSIRNALPRAGVVTRDTHGRVRTPLHVTDPWAPVLDMLAGANVSIVSTICDPFRQPQLACRHTYTGGFRGPACRAPNFLAGRL